MSMSKLRDAEDPLLIPGSVESETSEGEDSTDDMMQYESPTSSL